MLVRRPPARARALHQRLPRGPREDRLECVELHLETDSRRPRDHRAAGVAGGRRSWWVPHDGPSRAVEERDARVERAFVTFLTLRAFVMSRRRRPATAADRSTFSSPAPPPAISPAAGPSRSGYSATANRQASRL